VCNVVLLSCFSGVFDVWHIVAENNIKAMLLHKTQHLAARISIMHHHLGIMCFGVAYVLYVCMYIFLYTNIHIHT